MAFEAMRKLIKKASSSAFGIEQKKGFDFE